MAFFSSGMANRGGSYAAENRSRSKYDPHGYRALEAARTESYTNIMAAQADMAATQAQMMKDQYRRQQAYQYQMQTMFQGGSDFLSGWQSAFNKPKQWYSEAWNNIGAELGFVQEQRGKVDESFQGILDDITAEYEDFKSRSGETEAELFQTAREEAKFRREAVGQLREQMTPDEAGAAARAQADVAAQSERQRQAMAREAAGYGLDPSSGRFMQGMQKSRMDEARNAAIAMNLSREQEKARAAQIALGGLSTTDPASMSGAAMRIREYGGQLLGMKSDVTQARERTKLGYTQAAGNLLGLQHQTAHGYAEDISKPYAEMSALKAGMMSNLLTAGMQSGMGMDTSYTPNQQVIQQPAPTTNYTINIPEGMGEPLRN